MLYSKKISKLSDSADILRLNVVPEDSFQNLNTLAYSVSVGAAVLAMKILYFLLYDLAKPRLVPRDHALKGK